MVSSSKLLKHLPNPQQARREETKEGIKGLRAHETYLIARPLLTVPRVGAPVVSLGHESAI